MILAEPTHHGSPQASRSILSSTSLGVAHTNVAPSWPQAVGVNFSALLKSPICPPAHRTPASALPARKRGIVLELLGRADVPQSAGSRDPDDLLGRR